MDVVPKSVPTSPMTLSLPARPCPVCQHDGGNADTASSHVAEQSECLSRKRWRERDDRTGFLRAVPDTSASAPG